MRSHIKRNSKKALKGNYSKSIAISMFILFVLLFLIITQKLIYSVFNINNYNDMIISDMLITVIVIAAVMFFIFVLFYSPIYIGVKKWYYKVACGNDEPVHTIFDFFTSLRVYMNSLSLYINILFRSLLTHLLIYAAPSAIFILSNKMRLMDSSNTITIEAALFVLSFLLFIICSFLSFYVNLRYFPALYLKFEYDSLSVREIIGLSVDIMKFPGRRSEVFKLYISFFPLFLLGVFIIPLVLFVPYIETTAAIYAKYYINKSKLTDSETKKFNASSDNGNLADITVI